ncbi:putative uncharacterized protein DDB_G0291608 isoform X1 [Centruroides sculpturatus]|uniref:putative uncharacterized protein DDB_G0291608 isoform X1 n=2 Tax=Centruroides sculpturatus TaxID=218467 RepID=UPI000C6D2E2F|nr:putative uncharacterized protein DDB_G0291608 isoform X1 [Centruroides sculpturatus]XP_023231051.1 putative uncharacterized protein DDB_G0291608 isoform X1 [Centruroides sculpturatus]
MKNYSKLITTRHYDHLRKMDSRSTKKLIALKLLRNKNSSLDKKSNSMLSPQRKLRPRFPYSASDEWPVARAHRMASLNARAKVHILYENECRGNGNDSYESEEGCGSETGKSDYCDRRLCHHKQTTNKNSSFRDKQEKQNSKLNEKSEEKVKRVRKRRNHKRKLDDVEIIDTRSCKRMANLNAQAILAASYLLERSRKERNEKKCLKNEKKSDLTSVNNSDNSDYNNHSDSTVSISHSEDTCENIIVDDLEEVTEFRNSHFNISNSPENRHSPIISVSDDQEDQVQVTARDNEKVSVDDEKDSSVDCTVQERCELHSMTSANDTSRTMTSTAVSKVGMTEYTEVTKVHINTTEDMGIKEEGKVEQKIEHILEKDDVAITRMYHYQTKGNSQSYCLQMQTTYKPSSTKGFTPPPSVINRSSPRKMHLDTPPHVMSTMLHNSQSYYSYPSHSPVIPDSNTQTYPISHGLAGINNIPMVNVGPLARHYSSAFTVPHYGHPPPMPYPPSEYGYYQPAGPLIQPIHDPCLIHKPVPYHPQHHHLHPPQNSHASYPDQCLSHHSLSSSGPPPPHQNSHCSIEVHPPPPPPPQPPHYPQNNIGNNSSYQISHHQVNQTSSQPPSSVHHQPYSSHGLPMINYCPNHTQNQSHQSHLYSQHGSRFCPEYSASNYRIASSLKSSQKERNATHSVSTISPLPTMVPKSEPVTPPETKINTQDEKLSNMCNSNPRQQISSSTSKKKLEKRLQETRTEESSVSNNTSIFIPSVHISKSVSSNNDIKSNIVLINEKSSKKPLQKPDPTPCEKVSDNENKQCSNSFNNKSDKSSEHQIINSVQRRARLLKLRHHLKQSLPAYPININVDQEKYESVVTSKPVSNDIFCKLKSTQQLSSNTISGKENSAVITMNESTENESEESSKNENPLPKSKNGEVITSKVPQKKLFVSIPRLVFPKKSDNKQFSNGWSWIGEPFEKLIYYNIELANEKTRIFESR